LEEVHGLLTKDFVFSAKVRFFRFRHFLFLRKYAFCRYKAGTKRTRKDRKMTKTGLILGGKMTKIGLILGGKMTKF